MSGERKSFLIEEAKRNRVFLEKTRFAEKIGEGSV
jgi:hypothetical protein